MADRPVPSDTIKTQGFQGRGPLEAPGGNTHALARADLPVLQPIDTDYLSAGKSVDRASVGYGATNSGGTDWTPFVIGGAVLAIGYVVVSRYL